MIVNVEAAREHVARNERLAPGGRTEAYLTEALDQIDHNEKVLKRIRELLLREDVAEAWRVVQAALGEDGE